MLHGRLVEALRLRTPRAPWAHLSKPIMVQEAGARPPGSPWPANLTLASEAVQVLILTLGAASVVTRHRAAHPMQAQFGGKFHFLIIFPLQCPGRHRWDYPKGGTTTFHVIEIVLQHRALRPAFCPWCPHLCLRQDSSHSLTTPRTFVPHCHFISATPPWAPGIASRVAVRNEALPTILLKPATSYPLASDEDWVVSPHTCAVRLFAGVLHPSHLPRDWPIKWILRVAELPQTRFAGSSRGALWQSSTWVLSQQRLTLLAKAAFVARSKLSSPWSFGSNASLSTSESAGQSS
mmetsp:Transcript_42982/g.93584  ORF Transcript_42982/g.93584 Transcript_42982/m.93584 type:complete len:292 (-) Transcript_42982:90-965(-)